AHILDTANGALKLVALAGQVQDFLLGQTTRFTGKQIIEFAQTADRVRDRLPVGQHAAKPTMVDVVLRALLCRLSDRLGGLTLRADKKHAATGSNHVTHCDERLMKQRNGLREVDDVDIVTIAEEELLHLRVPAVGLVTKVNTSFQQLTHRKIGECHDTHSPFPVEPPRGVNGPLTAPHRTDQPYVSPVKKGVGEPNPACGMAPL